MCCSWHLRAQGSSPLTRGKLRTPIGGKCEDGLIPAHAGKTSAAHPRTISPSAHPRSRGENSQAKTIPARGPGSSPLTRGKQTLSLRWRRPCGLIPAHAGKTIEGLLQGSGQRAHPRSRGENGWPARNILPDEGSSPLTRGKRWHFHGGHGSHRLIPAHAGKTGPSEYPTLIHRAHPRSRGENQADHERAAPQDGSSPLTRGKPRGGRCLAIAVGLIPAHAGKTSAATSSPCRPWAHPRSRGEN